LHLHVDHHRSCICATVLKTGTCMCKSAWQGTTCCLHFALRKLPAAFKGGRGTQGNGHRPFAFCPGATGGWCCNTHMQKISTVQLSMTHCCCKSAQQDRAFSVFRCACFNCAEERSLAGMQARPAVPVDSQACWVGHHCLQWYCVMSSWSASRLSSGLCLPAKSTDE